MKATPAETIAEPTIPSINAKRAFSINSEPSIFPSPISCPPILIAAGKDSVAIGE